MLPPRKPPPSFQTLPEPTWKDERARFESQMRQTLADARARHTQEGKDPVNDFLFEYYSFTPTTLARWSPGLGYFLEGQDAARTFHGKKGWLTDDSPSGGAWIDPSTIPPKRRDALRWITTLLEATQSRAPFFGCGGMHEWAMVYRSEAPRHAVPLRMSAQDLAEFVESRPIVCSHYDAFRFFTPAARPLNRLQPAYDQMHALEQPGCLHANMDLYRWAYKFYPWIASALIAEAFTLASAARRLDMEASPYDLRAQGLEPIPVETPEGRALYQQRQRALWEAGTPLRARLIKAYRRLASLFPELSKG